MKDIKFRKFKLKVKGQKNPFSNTIGFVKSFVLDNIKDFGN